MSGDSTEYLDELGRTTLEDKGSCHTLIEELDHRLNESPAAPPLLWRLSRAQVHLSMHCEQKGMQEEEKQLLVKGGGRVVREGKSLFVNSALLHHTVSWLYLCDVTSCSC